MYTTDAEMWREYIAERATRNPETGCVEWQRSSSSGYGHGRMMVVAYGVRRNVFPHRVAYALRHGEDPGEMLVLHKCNNPACCNPDHLALGDDMDNSMDRQASHPRFVGIAERKYILHMKLRGYTQEEVSGYLLRPVDTLKNHWRGQYLSETEKAEAADAAPELPPRCCGSCGQALPNAPAPKSAPPPAKGKRSWKKKFRKLTDADVHFIRRSALGDSALAKKFDVSRGLIQGVQRGALYADIAPEPEVEYNTQLSFA